MSRSIDIISRKTSLKNEFTAQGNTALAMNESGIVVIHDSVKNVASYERSGNDLIIHMQDGSVIRCVGYFENIGQDNENKLVFQDENQQLTEIDFTDATAAHDTAAFTVHAVETPLAGLEPLLLSTTEVSVEWPYLLAGVLGAGAVGALLGHSGGSDEKTKVIDNTKDVEVARPTFLVTDTQGDSQGILANQAVTDDVRPTFTGTGNPGAEISIVDASGKIIATTLVDASGQWTAQLAPQSAGSHTYIVVQESNGSSTSAGSITLNIVTEKASLSVDTLAGDNVLNAAEAGADVSLSGQSANLAAGTTVTVSLNGSSWQTTVAADGSWSVNVPAADAQALADGVYTVQVSGVDRAGNTITSSSTLTVDTHPPALVINTVAGDDILNAAEAGQPLTLSGTSDAGAGQVVTLLLNGIAYSATVDANGHWSVDVPAAHAGVLKDGNVTVSASVSDTAGNSTSTTHDVLVDTTVPVVTINTIAGDNILNSAEQTQAQIVSGTSTGGEAGDTVTLLINGQTYTTTLAADGSWSVGLPASVFSSLADGSYEVNVSITDKAGNTGSQSTSVLVASEVPELAINTVATDDVINAIEKGEALEISGTSNSADGTPVTLTLNGITYTGTVSGGNWTVTVPATDVSKLGEATYTLSASITDAEGNSGSATHNVVVDSVLPNVTIAVTAGDDIVNATEINADQTISGKVTNAAAGDVVTVTVGGNVYTTTVQNDLSWSVSVPSADLKGFGDGDLTINASVTNQHGNTGTNDREINIDAGLPGLRIDTVAGDDVVNSIEIQQNQIVSGTSTDIAAGSSVTVTINGVDYQATVGANGAWSAAVPSSDVANWPAGALNISVTGSDASGNSVTISNNVTVDLSSVAITVDTIAVDDIINAAEKAADLTLSGSTQNVEAGQTVTVNFAGHTYTATVQDNGSWSVKVPAGDMTSLKDGDVTATASVTNVAGNSASAANTAEVDASAPAITINTIAGDNVLNSAEAGADVVLSGTSTAEAGQVVTLTLNGKDYTATVGTDGTWSTSVPAADASALTDGTYSVNATVKDVAGNSSSVSGSVLVDITPPALTINTVSADDVINAQEHQQNLMISGGSTGVPAGGLVTVDIDGHNYTAAVDANGNWSVGVPADVVSTLTDGSYTVSASVKDAAGNDGSVTHDVTVDTVAPVLTINTVAADDVINAIEKGEALTVSGTSNGADGSTVTLNLNGQNYTATVTNGAWTLNVPASDVAKLGEADYTLTASSTDAAGNTGSATHDILVDSSLPSVSISPVATDNIVNATEINADQLISGKVTNAAAGDTVTITLGGKTYTAEVQDDLSWSVSVPSADLKGFGDGDLTINASVTNQHGNTGTNDREINIDAGLPGLRINTVAGDDIVNSIEIQQNQIVSGTSTDIAAGSSVTVTINGVDYQATVGANGAWSAAVPSSDVANWPAGALNISVTGSDASGNSVTISNNVTVDLSSVAITVDTIAVDDIINAAEKAADLTLSGSTQNVEAGQTVTVNFAGHTYTATVQDNGSWSVKVLAGDMTGLKDGDVTATASVTNVAGNSASAANTAEVDASAPAITINTIAGDNVLNSAEAGADVVLSGTSTAEAGQVVTLTLNGNEYTATVGTDGTWSTSVPAADASALTDGTYSVNATVKDVAGNSSSVSGSVLVDITAPALTINTISADDVINAQEHQQNLMISGGSTGVPAGGLVTVEIDGHSYTAAVDANGNWSVGVPANVVSTLTDGSYTISASVKDAAGNDGSVTHDVTVDTVAPVLTINTVAADDVINAIEKGEALTVSGTSNGADGSTVTLNLNGQNYTATVSNGAWTLNVPASDVAKLGEADYTLTASSTDAAGNTGSATHDILVDSSLPSVSISPVATDNIVNATEINADQTISGKVTNAAAGDTVTITLGGKTYTTTVQDDLSWSVSVPSADLKGFGDGDLTINASVTNQYGNTGTNDREINIDAGLPGLRINTVAGDDVVNSIEIQQNQIVSGTSTDIAAGSSVTVTINGVDYQATVGANGAWSAAVPAADVANWPAGALNISVTGSDASGNSVTISNNVTVDLSSVAITVDTIAVDDIINAAEKAADLTLTGSTQNVEAGQTVTVNFAGHTYTATVQDNGSWSVKVPAGDMTSLKDGDVTATASVTNVAGNSASAANTAEVDASAPAITINTIAGDNVLNSAEAGADVVLSGTSTAEAGQVVTLTLNGNEYTATVGTDGTWSTSVPAADASALTDGTYSVSATVKDVAGNSSSVSGSVLVDITPPALTINTVSADDVINAQEHQQNLLISGGSTGVPAGGLVTVEIDGHSYTAAVDANGNWSVGVPANVVSTLTDGSYTVTASVKDAAGNDGSITHDVTVDTVAPVLTINTVAADDVINAIEKGEALTVSGTSNGADGSTVTLNLNGQNYTATVSNGAWTLNVPASDIAKLGEADYTLTASSTDAAGNTGSATHDILVDSSLPSVSISPVATDNIVNATEINADQTISGKVTNAAAGDTVTLTLGGKTYTAEVQSDLSWSVSVPSADLKGFGDGDLTISASVTNQHGNTGSADREINIDAGLPGLRINTVAGDDVVNSIEIQQNQIVSGTSTDIAAGSSVTVTINGVDYQATVGANGAWSAAVPAADVANWPAGALNISVTGTDASGNSVTISNNVTVDLSSVAISVDTIAVDDMINAAEKAADLTLTGSTQNVEAGQTVTVNFAGHTYTATVQGNGSWSVKVPAGDMTSLKDGDVTATASVTNVAGNSASAANTAEVDASAPTITINTIAGDNVLNSAEAGADVVLSGTSTAEAGQIVIVTLNGNEYTATVGTDGTWSTSVPAADASALTDGTYSVNATVKDVAGNSSSVSGSVLVDITPPALTINTVSADDVINAQEHQQNLLISGGSTGVPAGGLVTVEIDGHSYTAAVDANGNWSVGVPANVVSTLTDGSYTVTASVKDAAGNDGSITHDVTVDTVAPVLTINTVAADDVINAIEKGEALTVSGTSNGADGSVITLNLNGQNYTATVTNGAWALNVPASDVAKLGEADYTLTASSTDAAGNTGSATHDILVDSSLPSVSISPVATDNIVNATEINADQLISGKVTNAAAGDTVTITLGGKTYTAEVQSDLSWSVSVPSADLKGFGDGDLTISASVTNQHGNTGTNDREINIDAGLPGLRIDTVAGDDVVNSIEIQQNQIVSGTSTDIAAGSSVTVIINGVDYQATVGANGAWSAAVPAADVANWPAGALNISVTGTDVSGNSVTISNNVTVDLSSVAITVDTIAVDDMINAAEKAADLTLSGSTQNVEAGQTVTVNFAGHTYTATVQDNGSWSVKVPAGDMTSLKDGDVTATASVTNVAGNSASAANTAEVDASAPAITINTIAGDNVLNSAEAGADVVLSGTSTAEAGQVVTITLNGNEYTATVGTDGTWSTSVPAADASALTDGTYSVNATVKDVAGNSSSVSGSVLVDITAPALTINTISADDVINAQEHQQNLMISGGSTGVPTGGLVTVEIDGHSYTAAVDANGNWSVGVPANVVSTLTDGSYTISASVKDAAGNDGSMTHDVTVDTVAPVLTINTVAADDVINAIEKGEALTVSGTSNGTDGSVITLNLNGQNYTATVTNGTWTLNVPASDVAKLGEADYTLTASSTDAAGNTGSATHDVLVDSSLPSVSISPVATDNIVNATEINADQTISGKVTNAAAGDVVTLTLGGKTYTTTVQDDLSWSVSVPSADLKGFGDGDLTINASVTNQHGNTGSADREINIDAGLPGLRIDTVAGDDVVNSIEIQQNQIVSGTSTDIAAGSSVTVTINGVDYQATVGANGAWSAAVPSSDVANWPAGALNISVTGTDVSGNSVTISNNVTVDLSSVAITVDTIAVDDMINAAEKAADLTLSGSTQNVEAGQTVTVNFAGHTYTATVQDNGSWSVKVPAGDMTSLKDGDVTATASVTNVAGNSASAANTAEVDASAPTVTIQTISASDVLTAINAGTEVTLSGTSTAQAGQTVTITLGSETYTATVAADGTWTTGVPNSVFSDLGDGSYTLTASVSDIAGNPATATGTAQVDLTAPEVTINTVAGDNVINSTEHGQAQVISGTVSGVDAGSVVTVTINNVDYRAVSDGSGNWSVGVPANVVSGLNDGSYTITAKVTDTAGNTGSASRDVTVETTAPVFVINDMAGGDNILNAAEAQTTLTVTGTVTGLADGATVIVTLNGLNYQGTVNGGVWSADIPASDLANLGQALYQVSVSGTDVYGNSGSSAKTLQTSSDSPAVTINTVAGDDVINATEITQDQVISGTVTHAEAGQTVTVTVGGKTYTAEVQNDLSWSLTVPAADLAAMGDGSLNISASVTNTSGNSGSGERDIVIDAAIPGLRIDTIAGDDIVNSIEINQNQIVSGTSTGLAAGSSVTVTINGVDYAATVGAGGKWSAAVPAADVANWPAGELTVSVSGTSTAGNSVTISNDITVDLSSVSIAIDTVSTDNMLNAAEKAADLTLSGTTLNVEAGQTVTVIFAGHSYTTQVQTGGTWSLTVPAADMTLLKDGDASIQVSVTNTAGNSASAAQDVTVDTVAPVITINTIAGDNVLNSAEAGADVVLSGTSTAEAGQIVTVTLNGNEYTATVGTDGTWSTSVPAADASALTDGTYSVNATVKDVAGNSSSVSGSVLVDITPPALTINTVSADDVINAQEHQQNLMISGGSTGVPAGGLVTVDIDGHSYTAAVDTNGNWSVGVPANVVSTLTDGSYTVSASVKDAAGNDGSVTHDVTVDTVAPVLTINTVAADDVINAIEKGEALTVSGTSNGADGSTVTLNLNGQNYTATVTNGAWTLNVPASDVAKLGEADYTLTASSTDAAGNTGSATHDILVDSSLPSVSISPVATDNIVNATEINADQLISGKVTNAAAGDTVTITLGGKTYTAEVQSDLSWSVSVPSADLKGFGDGDLTISASVTNQHGNTGTNDREINIDAGLPGLRINTVAGDDVVNSIEIQQNQIVSGTSTDIAAGSSVTVTINGVDYQATVGANGAWSAAVPAADVANWPAGALNISVTGTDVSGNSVTISNNVTVDLSSVAITVDIIAVDDIINAAEKAADLTLSGSTQNVEAGQTVTVNFAGHTYTATVQDNGSWSVKVPAGDMTSLKDGDVTATASVTNVAGNSASAANTAEVDASAPVITINTIAGDNVLNSAEAGADVLLSGTSTAEAGQVVTITLNGKDYTATVGTDGTWSTSVPAADASALTDGTYSVNATVKDVAGNSSSVSGSVLVDITAPALTINTISADDVINAQEHQQNLMISGGSTGVPAGGLVTVDIDGHSYTAAVDANGNWSVGVPADVVSTLTDGSYTVTASVKDAAGNDGSVTHDVTVDTVAPVLTINTVAADDVINAIEKGEALTVSGTSNGTDGSVITLNLNGQNYTATVTNGAWTLNVPASDVAKLGEADYTLTASSTDAAGNTGSATHDILVDSSLPSVNISPVATDNIVNATEINADQLISGKVTNAAAGDTVTITLGGKTYTAEVQSDLSWSVSVPSADLKGFGDGDLTISASVTNQHGNTGTNDREINIDAGLPGLRINTVAGDDVVNSIEIQQNQIVSGTSTDIAAGSSVTVTINGVDYQATVGANGAWSAAVPAADVANWPAGALNISVTGSDASGNSVTISNNVTVDLSSVAISVDTIAADDMINAAEKAADLTLTGSTQNVEAGQTVTVNFAGHTYTATVQDNGSWSVKVPAGDMTSLKDGDVTATASVTNVAGNSASAANTAEVDASAPAITINTIAGDNVLNSAEAGADVVLSGTSTAEAGQIVTVTLNGNEYTATVGTDGSWSTSVPAADASALTDGTYSVNATVKDVAGNSSSVSGSVLVDITAPVVSVNTVAGDDVINAAEHSQAQVISGGSTGTQPGNLVTLVIGGVTYSTVVDASGNWSVGVPASVIKGLASGENTISVSITDSAGNTGSSDHLITVNASAVSLSIDTIAQDDIINAAEKGTSLTISGGSDMLATGTEVTVVLNGKSYTAEVGANGAWTLSVPSTDLAAIADGNYTVSASASDAAGNTASTTHNVAVDATAPALLINPVTADGMLNAAELGQPLTLSGTSTAQPGQTVSVTLNNETYTTTVNTNGTWSVNVPADDVAALKDGTLTVTASTTDVAGNPASANTSVIVDTVAPTLTISTIAGDDIINTTEQLAGQTISGTTSAEAGQIVTVTFNNREYHATVTTGGTWSVNVPAADFNGAADGSYTVTASVKDVAGNPAATDSSVSLSGAGPEITINTFAQDDVVSAAEHSGPLAITGTSTAAAGSTVTVTLNGVTYTTQVANDQTWTLNLSANAVNALADGENYSITASVTNSIGNSGSASHDIAVDTTAPSMTISIDSVSDDTGRSTSDFVTSDNTITLKGALSAALGNNESAQISLDGGVTWTTLTVTGTTWSYAQGSALADGSYTYNVRVIDAAGNVGSTASQTVVIDTVAPDASQTISIDAISQDTGLSSSDFITSDTTINLRGTLGAALGADEYAQISLDGGTTWNDVSISGLTWTYIDGRTLTDGDYNYQMRVVDLAGNVGATASQVVTIDTTAPDSSKTVSVDAISTDTGLSSTDFVTSDTSLTVTGSLGATLAADEVVQVSVDGGLTWANATTIGTGWTFTDGRTLTDGDYTYNVRVVDAAGNVGNVTSKVVTVDTTAPDSSKTVTIDSITTDTGSSASDFVTSDTSLTVKGSIGAELSPGEVVQISIDNGATWTTVTLQGSTWTYVDGRTLTDGQTLYQVRVVDQAGNVGQTAQQVVTIDTTAPTQIITIEAISNDTGDSASDFITSDNTLTMTGSLSAALATDERAQISLDGGKTWSDVVVNGLGWSYDATGTVLADGNYNVQVRVIDQAGNIGTIGSQTVVIDTLNPEAVATIVQYSDDEGDRTGSFGSGTYTDETAPTLSGTLSKALADGEVLKIYRNGVYVGVATVVGLAWTFSDSALADGTYIYVAKSQDLAGNTTSSTDFTLTVDTSIPTTIATVTPESSQDTTPIISGTLSEALGEGMYVQVVVNGVTYTSETGGAVVVDPLNNTWYLQVPGALGLASYDVTAQVRSSAGNGNDAGISTSAIVIYAETAVDTSWATTAGATSTNAMAFSLNSSGLWNIVTGISDYTSSGLNSYTGTTLTNSRGNIVVSYTLADTDRNGTSDIYATETNYGGYIQGKWTANTDGTYTYGQQAIGTLIWYGGVIAYDKTGDGWVDLAYGDAGGDSRTYLVNNNGVVTPDGTNGAAGLAGVSYREISGVDINNDGTVDIVQHTNRNGVYALTVVNNNGTGTLSETQSIANVFVPNAANTTTAVSMTWADFNGDGLMDLYISSGLNPNGTYNYGGAIYYNSGQGTLLTTPTAVETSTTNAASAGYLSAAVDWDGDGDMDIIKFSTYGTNQSATLYLNDGTGKGWTNSALASSLVNVTGIATLDYDWNGTQDLLVSQANGKVVYIANNSTIADGTAIHLRILDGEGMNVFYGNTVQLYNSAGELVASQIINAQSGIGINDASALVNFYGLDPNETYSAVLVRNINGVSSNATWNDLTAGDGTSSYSLTADAATGGNSGTITGTGYNDTFIAESGTYVYNGSGGWSTTSDHATWSATGGQDIVDFRNATSGVTVDLSSSNAQNTGFNTSTFRDIEGIAGSNYDDVFTGSAGDNVFEGRGGNDTFNLGNGGHDTLLYKLLDSADATGGNGSDTINGFTVGTWEGTANSDRLDLSELLQSGGYTGTGSASYVNGVATLDASAGNITDYLSVTTEGNNTVIKVDMDGSGSAQSMTTIATLNNVHTDLATLLANHQLIVG